MPKQRLAVIGSGISGMATAYFLKDQYEITLYEKEDRIGGHTNTVTIVDKTKELLIDTGFIVYNERTYPLLSRLFDELEVKTKPTSMSFSVQHCQGWSSQGRASTAFSQTARISLTCRFGRCFGISAGSIARQSK